MIFSTGIHLHLPRTGGSLFRSLVQELIIAPGLATPINTDAHVNLRRARIIANDKQGIIPAFVFVRNPFDWYVSRWLRSKRKETDAHEFFPLYLCEQVQADKTITHMLREITEGPGGSFWYRFETLVPDLVTVFSWMFPQVSAQQVLKKVSKLGSVRANPPHPHYSYFFTDGLVSLVREVDSAYIDRFDYKFEERRETWMIPNIRNQYRR